ncbi:RNA polymerase sigma factor [Nocardia sp. NPDC057668]|uniref:RNA polymerase sigma factor n=1 Tax=Nocardia sp. NPDC057668 TaxID=3346202 RepID=UPI00366D45B2
MTPALDRETEDLLRTLAPQVLGVLVRRYGDFDAAEDAVQEAMLAAATQWPGEGRPDNPRGWLIQVGQRRLVDAIRAEVSRRTRETASALGEVQPADPTPETDQDDTLTLFFLCCHPALSPASAIALTLRAVGGLTTEEIARAFLLPEATMAQRISRAKKRLADVDRPFAMPGDEERDGRLPAAEAGGRAAARGTAPVPAGTGEQSIARAGDPRGTAGPLGYRSGTAESPRERPDGYPAQWRERLGAVLRVLYLIFTEGHSAAGSELRRNDLAVEAIRLARALHRLLPEDHEVTGLLALLLLTDARRAARSGPHGELIPLTEQDRSLWDRTMIIEGVRLASASVAGGLLGPYRIQAAIAVLHAQALRPQDTDWDRILLLYNALERVAPGPMVTLNRAVANAMVHGPEAGLELAATLEKPLAGSHRLDAVRGHLYEMTGDHSAAITAYLSAARRTTSLPERDYLTLRAAHLRELKSSPAQ